MKVLLVGNGGREHAMAVALCKSPQKVQFYAFAGARNPGIARLARENGGELAVGDIHNPSAVANWAKSKGIEYAVIGPDAVLAAGVVDALETAGVKCASPLKEAARLEWDKTFARNLMRKYSVRGIPEFAVFEDAAGAARFIDELGKPVAIKPAGLTGGKGVKVVGAQLKDNNEAKKYCGELIKAAHGGLSAVVVEERLEGEEFTLQAFSDGKSLAGMPAVQDHKRAFEGDLGPNTGGMGSYSDANGLLPFMTQADYDSGLAVMRQTIDAFNKETGLLFKGVLYGQFMLTKEGPMVIEFNARFGDPEAMNVLTLLESDFAEIVMKTVDGTLSQGDAIFEKSATVCKYLVPKGYPDSPAKDEPVIMDELEIEGAGAHLYYAAVNESDDGAIYTTSSRTAGIVGVSDTLEEAEKIAEYACRFVSGEVFHRKDIGTKALIQKRIEHMKKIRG